MVIIVYAEGGTLDSNANASTMNNVEALREELNRFMTEVLGCDDVQIVVRLTGGYKNAAKRFIASADNLTYLYVDLDRLPEKRSEWFSAVSKDGIDIHDTRRDKVFFWIQEMEAWFLKQPQAIEDWASEEDFPRQAKAIDHIANHKSIKGKDIERLQQKPSVVLNTILRQTFQSKTKRNSDLRYGKIAHAPGIISHLIPKELVKIDNELRSFVDKVSIEGLQNLLNIEIV